MIKFLPAKLVCLMFSTLFPLALFSTLAFLPAMLGNYLSPI